MLEHENQETHPSTWNCRSLYILFSHFPEAEILGCTWPWSSLHPTPSSVIVPLSGDFYSDFRKKDLLLFFSLRSNRKPLVLPAFAFTTDDFVCCIFVYPIWSTASPHPSVFPSFPHPPHFFSLIHSTARSVHFAFSDITVFLADIAWAHFWTVLWSSENSKGARLAALGGIPDSWLWPSYSLGTDFLIDLAFCTTHSTFSFVVKYFLSRWHSAGQIGSLHWLEMPVPVHVL